MTEAPDGYRFTVDFEKTEEIPFRTYYSAVVRLWSVGDEISGCIGTDRVNLLDKTEKEVVATVNLRKEGMLRGLAREVELRDLVKRNFS